MKPARALIIVVLLVLSSSILFADGPVGVYAMVQKVVIEPSAAPATIQVWGVFVWVDGGLKSPGPINIPQRGYIYFKLPPGVADAAATKKQWADIKAVAGTQQIIAFGGWTYAGPFEDLYIPVPGGQEDVRVRKPTEAPAKPITYPVKTGLARIASDSSHAELTNLMKAFLQR